MKDILQLIKDERARQDAKWGPQHHDDGTWLLILIEEVGERIEGIGPKIAALLREHGIKLGFL